MHRLIFAAGFSLLFSTTAAFAADWPTYRQGNSRTAATTESLSLPLKASWVYEPSHAPQMAWPSDERTVEKKVLRDRVKFDDAFHVAVVGQRVYFGSSVDHRVHCRDAAIGKEIWSFHTGGPVRLAPTVADGRVYFGSDDGRAYCLNAADGRLIWKLRAGPADEWLLARGEMISRWPLRTGITVDQGIAYFGAGIFPHEDIYLYAVHAKDGKILWKRDNISESEAGRNDLSPQGYQLVSDTTLFIPSGRTLPAAIDRKTGKLLFKTTASWRGNGGGVIGGTKAVLADGQLYSGGAHHYVAIDQKTGRVGYGYIDGKQLAIAGDAAYIATDKFIARLNRKKYMEASRKRQKISAQISSISRRLRRPGKNAGKDRKQLAALKKQLKNLMEGTVVWTRPSGLHGSLIAAGNLVFVGGTDKVVAFDAKTGKDLWSAKVDGTARGLAVANGRLYVSTTSGKIYSFAAANLPAAKPAVKTPLVKNPFPSDKLTKQYETAAIEILKQSGAKHGFCLVLGSEEGRLAFELAKRSGLKIYCIEPDAEKVARSRKALAATGLYGSRIVVHHADFSAVPYANFFANLIVSDRHLLTGKLPGTASEIVRHLKPLGGVIALGGSIRQANDDVKAWLTAMKLKENGKIETRGAWITLTRGKLPGAGNWSHLYGDSGNTASSNDTRVRGGLGVLWYGDPGPGKMVNRHEGAVGPLAVNGRLFVQGTDSVMAYDAYNGRKLWEVGNKGALRTGVFQNFNPGNLVASEDALFVMDGNACAEIDAATGKIRRTHRLPKGKSDKAYKWGYLAYNEGILYGTATMRKELDRKLRRRGRKVLDATDAIFAIDIKTGKHLWTYQGKSISHHTIALGPNRVYFIDSSVTSEQRAEILRQDKSQLKNLSGAARKRAEQMLKKQDLRLAVAIDARSGKKEWSKPVDVTDCSVIGIGGGQLTLIYKDGVLLLCGANANGHYWRQFMAGDFSRRRLVALWSGNGRKMWAKDANYRHRPIVVENQIIAEPWIFDLYTGTQKTRPHPLTGKDVPWSMIRPGHHCGMLTGCPSMLLFRSKSTAFYDLKSDSGTRHFAGHRLGCWINAIPANGLVMIPEASAGCVCLFSIASTITMEPRKPRRPWTIYSAIGPQTPVKHFHLNLGAPGDRKDARGTIWLAYPRPNPHKVTGLDLKLDFQETRGKDGGYVTHSERSKKIAAAGTPWIYNSSARGVTKWTFPLLGKNDKPAVYTVTLHFAELEKSVAVGQRVFDVKIQGKTVLRNFDPLKAAGAANRAVLRIADDIRVTGSLVLELIPRGKPASNATAPVLNAVEIVRKGE
ncbi:MAG: PQQ-binding-like beta-propeller repeat protein [Planctomycetes bacterium]|nr:PQQ-binding-like beta-propeller repeat protein [Planctomycetota bacterium]